MCARCEEKAQTHRHTESWTDGRIDRRRSPETDMDRRAHRHTESWTERQTDGRREERTNIERRREDPKSKRKGGKEERW